MELIDAQMSLWLSAFPESIFALRIPAFLALPTTELTTVQLSLQFSLSSPRQCTGGQHGGEVHSGVCVGLWAARLRRARFPVETPTLKVGSHFRRRNPS